ERFRACRRSRGALLVLRRSGAHDGRGTHVALHARRRCTVARGHEWLVAVAVCLVSSGAGTSSAAGNSPLRSVRRPAGVPSEYVLTPNGFLHPSCVISVRSDEVLG